MKLFLASMWVSAELSPAFLGLVGKPGKQIRLALIENAADVEGSEPEWVLDNRRALAVLGVHIDQIDLRQYVGKHREELATRLSDCDVIWLGGGNTYYLRWILKASGADEIICRLVQNGTVYGGGSAGAVVAGPTLRGFEKADDPNDAPELLLDGLNLTPTVVVPHWQTPDYGTIMQGVAQGLMAAGHDPVYLTNAQALIIDGELRHIIG